MNKEDKAMACANEIADQFRAGFCNDRMVEDFAEIIRKYIPSNPEPLSEERELLKELSTKDMVSYYYPGLINRIKEQLAKPEPEYKRGYARAELDLKREPLSDEEIQRLYENAEYLGFLAYKKGIKDAEKAHKIGVDDE